MGVARSDAPMRYEQRAVQCVKPGGGCQICKLNTQFQYCTVEEFVNPCGLLRVYGIVIAVLIPMAAVAGEMAVVLEAADSLAWNVMLGIIYLYARDDQ